MYSTSHNLEKGCISMHVIITKWNGVWLRWFALYVWHAMTGTNLNFKYARACQIISSDWNYRLTLILVMRFHVCHMHPPKTIYDKLYSVIPWNLIYLMVWNLNKQILPPGLSVCLSLGQCPGAHYFRGPPPTIQAKLRWKLPLNLGPRGSQSVARENHADILINPEWRTSWWTFWY